jgi:hypothetical protein
VKPLEPALQIYQPPKSKKKGSSKRPSTSSSKSSKRSGQQLAPLVPHAFVIPKPPGLPPPNPHFSNARQHVSLPSTPAYTYVPIPRFTEDQVLDEMKQRKASHAPIVPSRLNPSSHKNQCYWRDVTSTLEQAGKLPDILMRSVPYPRSRSLCDAKQCLRCQDCRKDSTSLSKSLFLRNLRKSGYEYHTEPDTIDLAPPEYTPPTEPSMFYNSTVKLDVKYLQEQFVLPPGYETLEHYVLV